MRSYNQTELKQIHFPSNYTTLFGILTVSQRANQKTY